MRSVKNTSKIFVVLAALGLALAGCEQRGADTTGDSGAPASGTSGGMNPPATSGAGDAGTEGGTGTGGTGTTN